MLKDFSQEEKSKVFDYLTILFVIGYLVIELFPIKGIRTAETQYLYLNILNFIVATSIYFLPELRTKLSHFRIQKSYIFVAYVLFFVFCGISIFTANNQIVSIFRWAQLGVTLMAFINLFILLQSRFYLIFRIAFIVGIFGFLQAGIALTKMDFSSSTGLAKEVTTYLRGNTGNVNIFSASLLIKIPFMLIGISHYTQPLKKWFLTISMTLSMICILFVNARASLLGLIFIFAIFSVYLFRSRVSTKQMFVSKIPFLLISLIFAFTYTSSMKKNDSVGGRYGSTTAVERLQQINSAATSENARIKLWKNAAIMTKDNPAFGIGIGNWSIEATPYESPKGNKFSFHTHNDYMEIFAETGIINGFIYLSIFAALLFVNLKTFLRNKNRDTQAIAVLALMTLVVYANDAFFNFPLYRPTMQLVFVLLLIISIVNSTKDLEISSNKSITSNYKIWGIFVIILSAAPIYVTYHSHKTMMLETKIYQDPVHKDITKTPRMKAEDILNVQPKFPNILQTSTGSFDEYIGTLFYIENNFDEAMKHFNRANEINPYIGKSDFYKYYINLKRGQKDSAYINLKSSFYRRAWSFEIYDRLLKMAITQADSTEILKAYHHYDKIHNDVNAFTEAMRALTFVRYSNKSLVSFIETESIKFHGDEKGKSDLMLSKIYSSIGDNHIRERKRDLGLAAYQQAIKLDSTNLMAIQGLGYYYSREKEFDKAITYLKKALEHPDKKDDGKIEFTIGLCYASKRELTTACEFLHIAKDKNYPRSAEMVSRLCK